MKAKWFGILVLVALIASLLPMSVFAGAPADLKVFVRNSTGGEVDLRLTDAHGDYYWFKLPTGISELELVEGSYEYYASTICGAEAGNWNLNVSKELVIDCKGGALSFNLAKRCDGQYWGTLYRMYSPSGYYLETFYVEHESVNMHDWLIDDGMPSDYLVLKGETLCWSDLLLKFGGWPYKIEPGLWVYGGV